MGTDIYLQWENMTKEEENAQMTGFSIIHGHVGYLRGAIWDHDSNKIIDILMGESREERFYPKKNQLKKRLETINFKEYHEDWNDSNHEWEKSFRDFVNLTEKKIEELGEGKVWILNSW